MALPTSSSQKVVFLDTDGVIKSLDFAGKLELLGANVSFTKAPESGLFYSAQTQKYYHNVNGELLEVDSSGVEGDPVQVAEIYEATFELPQGVAGVDGKDGINGIDGKDGKDGVDGKDGINGIDGKDGKPGKDGKSIVGPQGPKGEKGDSIVGPQGPQGPPGASSGGGISKATVVRLIEEYSPTGEVSKSFGYNISDQLVLISDSKGTKTFNYDSEYKLINIVGTGSYVSKNFSYDPQNKLTGVTVV